MKNLILLTLFIFTTLAWSESSMTCQSKVTCALYRDGEFVQNKRCFTVTPSGKERHRVMETLTKTLNMGSVGNPDIKYNVAAYGSQKNLVGEPMVRQYAYNIIQLEEYSNHEYRLKAGVVVHESTRAIEGDEVEHLNLDSYEQDKYPEIIAEKGTAVTKTFELMVPLAQKKHYSLKKSAKDLLTAAVAMPLITLKAIQGKLSNDENACELGSAYKQTNPLDQGEVLYAKSITIKCEPTKID